MAYAPCCHRDVNILVEGIFLVCYAKQRPEEGAIPSVACGLNHFCRRQLSFHRLVHRAEQSSGRAEKSVRRFFNAQSREAQWVYSPN